MASLMWAVVVDKVLLMLQEKDIEGAHTICRTSTVGFRV